MKTNTVKQTLEEISKTWKTPERVGGHAPMGAMDAPPQMVFLPVGHPQAERAAAEYDRDYFRAHPEDREKYGYTGP
jgi:hypothetical protein